MTTEQAIALGERTSDVLMEASAIIGRRLGVTPTAISHGKVRFVYEGGHVTVSGGCTGDVLVTHVPHTNGSADYSRATVRDVPAADAATVVRGVLGVLA